MKIKIIAHRGASGEAPENTMSAIRLALKQKVDFIEIDIRLSKEGIPVIIHDSTIDHENIHELSLEEIKKKHVSEKFSAKFPEEKIPTLAELTNATNLRWSNTGLMIEIKECPQSNKDVVTAVFSVLKKSVNLPKNLVIGSFSIEIILEIQKLALLGDIPIKIIGIIEDEACLAPFLSSEVDLIAIWLPLVSKELVKKIQSQLIELWVFTVDSSDSANFLATIPVDGIITNYPKRLT